MREKSGSDNAFNAPARMEKSLRKLADLDVIKGRVAPSCMEKNLHKLTNRDVIKSRVAPPAWRNTSASQLCLM